MINSRIVQSTYVKLYEQLRKFIWSVDIVSLIADLETSIYDAFIDENMSLNILNKLTKAIHDAEVKDVELFRAIHNLQKELSDDSGSYLKLYQVREVIKNEDK